jgi:RHS repeat-associated protein
MPPVGQANRLQEDAVYAYQYDFEGNRTRRTNKTTGAYEEYTWDHRNRLTRVTSKTAGGTVTRDSQYARDMFDRRIKKIVDLDGSGPGLAVTTRHVYDGDHVALAYDGASSLTNRYLHGPVIDQVLVDELIGTGNRWALTDHLGTVHDYIDNNGNFVERVGRNSFGLPVTDTAPTVDLLFGYWGRDWDPETQMTDARSRPLDHRTIKFVKEDDKGHGAGDPNLYRDVVNSPTHFTDPYGHQGRPVASPPAPRVYPSGAEIAEMVRDAGYVVEDGALVLRKPPALASMVPEPLSPRKHAELLKELFGGIGHAVADTVMGCVCPFSTHKISSMSVEELTAIIKEYRDGERYHPIFNPYVHSGIAREQYMREVLPGAMADGVLLGSLMLPFLRITSLSKPLLAQIASKLQGFVDDAAKLVDNGALMSTLTSREKFALYNHPELRELMRGKAIERIVSSTARL